MLGIILTDKKLHTGEMLQHSGYPALFERHAGNVEAHLDPARGPGEYRKKVRKSPWERALRVLSSGYSATDAE